MAEIIQLEEYRRAREGRAPDARLEEYFKPDIDFNEIFAKDFTKLEHALWGILKIKEILEYCLFFEDEWRELLLNLMEDATGPMIQGAPLAGINDPGTTLSSSERERLRETFLLFKTYVLDMTDDSNKREMGSILLLLDLLEKSPNRTRRKQNN